MIAAICIVDPDADRHVLEEIRVTIECGGIRCQIEHELILADDQFFGEQRPDAPVGIGLQLGDQLGAAIRLEAEEGDRHADGRDPQLKVQDVGRDGRTGIGHCYPPRMANLTIRVGDLHFTARWEAAAPRTVEAVRRLLPIQSTLIHCRWSGEGTWIPFGDLQTGVGYENHTSHPAPGELLLYTGALSECEILFPYGACMFSSKLGQLAGNHFASLVTGAEQLPELGRRALWDGAQEIEISEAI